MTFAKAALSFSISELRSSTWVKVRTAAKCATGQLKCSSYWTAQSSDQGLRPQGRHEIGEAGLRLWPLTSWGLLNLLEPQFPQPEDEETTTHPTPASVGLSA